MQPRIKEGTSYVTKPKRMREYLLQRSPYIANNTKPNKLTILHRSLQKQSSPKQSLNTLLKSQLVQLACTTRNRLKVSEQRNKQKQINLSINIENIRKGSLNIQFRKGRPRHNLSQRSLAEDQSKNSHRYSMSKNQVIFPYSTIERQNHKAFQHQDRNYRFHKRCTSFKKETEQLLNFRSKNRSLQKMSVELSKNVRRTIKDQNFIHGFAKGQKLGKGGFSVVWDAFNIKTKKRFAVKEINGLNQFQTHLAEISFSSYFFENGKVKQNFKKHPGVNALLTLYDYHISGDKVYIIYEKCTGALGELLFDIYEQAPQNDCESQSKAQKSFLIVHKNLYKQLRQSSQFIKNFIYQICQALDLLQTCNLVHSDVKTSNILINISENKLQYSFKLIDYGSSFFFEDISQYRLATPQYMPPQLINYLNKQKGKQFNQHLLEFTNTYQNMSAIDMWGLGCILIQMVHGVPLWLNNTVKIKTGGLQMVTCGKFATENRTYIEILNRQFDLIKNIDSFFLTSNHLGVIVDEKIKRIIPRMLELNPVNRIRPKQVLQILREDCQTI